MKIIKRILYQNLIGWRRIRFILKCKRTKGKYWIIRPNSAETGLFSYFNLFLPEILMAKVAGWVPVVDMQSTKNTYLQADQVGKVNAWEFYFLQPGGICIEQIDKREAITTESHPFRPGPYSGRAFYDDLYGEKQFWRKFVAEEIKVQEPVLNKATAWWDKAFKQNERVLGVLCRGTDYLRLQPTGHARQPQAEQCVEKTKELLRKWNCDKLYLCTEDGEILECFKAEFGDSVFYYEKQYAKDPGAGYITQVHFDRQDDARKQGEEYLIQILLLSNCNCLLAGPCGGTIGAELFSKGFDKEYIWDLGVYS